MPISKKALQQDWVHSYEEDTDTEMIFRPSSYNFPPSRGRKGFELKQDGTSIENEIAPTDANEESVSTWELQNSNLILRRNPPTEPPKIMQIVSVTSNKLVVRK